MQNTVPWAVRPCGVVYSTAGIPAVGLTSLSIGSCAMCVFIGPSGGLC